nr:hypothetical protein [Pseudomonas aeruginosa]
MSRRWGIANDPKVLARIAEQERRRGGGAARTAEHPSNSAKASIERGGAAKQPSAATVRAKKVALNNQDSRLDTLHYDEAENTLTLVFPGAELLNQNVALRMHNAKTSMLKATWIKRLEALMILNLPVYDLWKVNQQRSYPFIVEEVYATGEGQCLDVESVVAACKPVIDALVRTRFLPDDSSQYIAQPIAYTYRQRNNGLVLVLRPAPKPWGLVSDTTVELAQAIPYLGA